MGAIDQLTKNPKWNFENCAETAKKQNIIDLWNSRVKVSPKDVAIVSPNSKTVTYEEIHKRAEIMKEKLPIAGGNFVATLLPQSTDYIVTQIAIFMNGCVLVPIDPTLPALRIAAILEDVGHPLVVTNKEIQDRVIPDYKRAYVLETGNYFGPEIFNMPKPAVDGLAMCLYTSGTTGTPKGVYMKHSSIINFVEWFIAEHKVSNDDSSVFYSSPSFDMAVTQTWPFLLAGGSIYVPPFDLRRNLPEFEKWVDVNRITFLKLPSIVAVYFLNKFNLKHLRFLAFGGERITSLYGTTLPVDCPFHVGHSYGLTEGAMGQTNIIYEPGSTLTMSVGKSIRNLEVSVLDSNMNPVGTDQIGNIYLGGAGICQNGYHNRPAENRIAYITSGGRLLFKTGDLGKVDEFGALELVGRSDDQIKIAGNRIELAEIEIALNQHPLLTQAVVIYKQGPPQELKAFATSLAKPNGQLQNLNIGSVTKFLAARLPTNAIPTSLQLLPKFPLTPNGKIDKLKLLELAELDQNQLFPVSAEQTKVAELWSSILSIPSTSISLNHSFYQLGGNSLSASQLLHTLKHSPWYREITFAQFFERSTLREFTKLVFDQENDNSPAQYTSAELLTNVENELAILQGCSFPMLKAISRSHDVLLTGSTGYLGSFLLAELLRQTNCLVYCLVRAGTNKKALQRINDNLLTNYITLTPSEADRIVAVAADFTQQKFGLSDSSYHHLSLAVHKIVHCAADVHHFRPYDDVEPVNVQGTTQILQFSCHGQAKEVHYISTAAVNESYAQAWKETELHNAGSICGSGYSQSKWVAEKVVSEAGRRLQLPYFVYRIGDIGSDSAYKAYNHNDLFCNIIQSFVTTGSYVGGLEWPLYLKADTGSKALVQLFLKKPNRDDTTIRHLGYRAKGAMDRELQQIGLKRMSLPEWLHHIKVYSQNQIMSQKHIFVSLEWFSNRMAEFEFDSDEFISYLNFCWESHKTEKLLEASTTESLVLYDNDIREYIQKIKAQIRE